MYERVFVGEAQPSGNRSFMWPVRAAVQHSHVIPSYNGTHTEQRLTVKLLVKIERVNLTCFEYI